MRLDDGARHAALSAALTELVEKDPDLAETIRKLEDEYDSDLVNFQAEET